MPTIPFQVLCKICGNGTELQGCVDAGRSCEINRGNYLDLIGQAIYYRRCLVCGFLFTIDFDGWAIDKFRSRIYNADYSAADPDYASGARAQVNAGITMDVMRQVGAVRTLDYGGGDGTLARLLREQGVDAYSWDPIADASKPENLPDKFDVVTAFEVFEHTPTPLPTMMEAFSFLHENGLLLFSTLTLDGLARQATDHWYISPRNGHISIHTTASLRAMFFPLGWGVQNFNANLHVARRGVSKK